MRVIRTQIRPNVTQDRVVDATAEDLRAEISFKLGRMLLPLEPHEASRKAWWRKLSRLTGLGPRRVEKLYRGYVIEPKGREYKTVGDAYRRWLAQYRAKALETLQQAEEEYAELQRGLSDYDDSRRCLARGAGAEAGEVG
jgi:hypothetical protein